MSQNNTSIDQKIEHPLIIVNDDTCSLRYVDPPHSEESLEIPLRYMKGTQAGAICWCLGEDIAYAWPSKVIENYYDQLAAGHWIGLFDDKAGFEGTMKGQSTYYDKLPKGEEPRNAMVTLHRRGIDYVPLLIGRARNSGILFYGSFRMNDCHLKSDPRGMLSSKFWQEHQEWRLWEILDGRTYYNAAMDYSYPEVRQRKLDSMRETLQWYDMDGIELDFCRNPYTFQPSEAWEKREILTEFIRQVRRDLDQAAKKWGRRTELLLRVPFEEKKLHEAGMDVNAWLRESLVSKLIMSRPLNDYNQGLEPWLSSCREHGVAFYPSIEQGPMHNSIHNHVTNESADQTVLRQRAMAQNYLSQGAAGVYMFNFPCLLYQNRPTPENLRRMTGLFNEIGRKETLVGKSKQYAFWKDLPMQVESRRPAKFHQTIRFNLFDPDLGREDTNVQLSFHQVPTPNPHVDARHFKELDAILPPGWVTYWLNGQEVPEKWIKRQKQPEGKIASGFQLGVHEKITITPPVSAMKQGENSLGFYVPRFPEEHDPYIQIYELLVDVNYTS
ncbi:MAG: hypothetical protein IT447_09730 [Phycisphaerales bacterium]|nr:hypothetical protein [Phycisphaerales bacterium]